MKGFLVLMLTIALLFSIPVISKAGQEINLIKENETKVRNIGDNRPSHLEQESRRVDIIGWITEEIADYVYEEIKAFIEKIEAGLKQDQYSKRGMRIDKSGTFV